MTETAAQYGVGGRVAISLFDLTGHMLLPWAEAGYECHIFDIQHPAGTTIGDDGIYRHGYSLMHGVPGMWKGRDIAFVSAFPPCDHLAVSGARWFKGKGLRKLSEAINLFAAAAEFCEESGAPYLIENPVSTISSYWRKPCHTFHPWEYTGFCEADNYTKKTCIWTGGGFVMPAPCPADMAEPDDRIHKAAPGPDRANFRSATPMGFARACFEANTPIPAITDREGE